MNDSTNTTDQSLILGFLARVDRRLRVNEALEGLSLGLWGLSGLLLVSWLFGIWERPTPRTALLLIYGVALAGFIAWVSTRRKGLKAPAGVADERSDSKDALKSSLDFIGLTERTRWMDFQIHRTAELAQGFAIDHERTAADLAFDFVAPEQVLAARVYGFGAVEAAQAARLAVSGPSGLSAMASALDPRMGRSARARGPARLMAVCPPNWTMVGAR